MAGLEASLEESEEKLRLFQSNELRKEDVGTYRDGESRGLAVADLLGRARN